MTTRRQFLSAAAAPILPAAAARPNILFLYSDDHHWQCLGAAGNPNIHTPNIDALAARGVHFTNGLISTSQCCPSRGIMLSGLETYQSGLLSNGQTGFREGHGPTIVEQIRRSGYDTVLVGKWHIKQEPAQCGFAKAPLWLRGGSSIYQNPELRRGLEGKDETVQGHITDLWADTAIDYLSQAKQPFLLWLAWNAPHSPWYAAEKYRRRYEGKEPASLAPPTHPKSAKGYDWITYYSVITHLDEAVGRVIAALEKAGLWDNTLIVFLGDNGFMCGAKGLGGKVVPWDPSVRVPYLASGGLVKARGKLDAPVASVDLPATFLDYAGVKPAYPLSGQSLRQELTTGKSKREACFATWADGRPNALATGKPVEPFRLVRTRTHKYIKWESGKEALFDLRSDPEEENNLASDAAKAAPLKKLLAKRMKDTADPAAKWL